MKKTLIFYKRFRSWLIQSLASNPLKLLIIKMPATSVIAFVLFAIACNPSHKAQDFKPIEDKYCHLTELNYQEISDTIHRTQNGSIEGGLLVNGKAVFSDKINFDSIRTSLSAGNKVFLDQKTLRTVKVSQDYYENFNRMRGALCNLVNGLKSGILKEKEFKTQAAQQYLEINALFAGLPQQEKKNPN